MVLLSSYYLMNVKCDLSFQGNRVFWWLEYNLDMPLRMKVVIGSFSMLFDSKSRRDFHEYEDDESYDDECDEFLNKQCRRKGHYYTFPSKCDEDHG